MLIFNLECSYCIRKKRFKKKSVSLQNMKRILCQELTDIPNQNQYPSCSNLLITV